MNRRYRPFLSFTVAAALGCGTAFLLPEAQPVQAQWTQYPAPKIKKPEEDEGPRLPSGKLQRDAILEHEHKKNLEDLREIQKISAELIEELEASSGYVFSIQNLKKMEQMEKLSKQVKNRFKKQ